MAEPHVIDALRGKRSELSGIVSHLEQQIVQHRASLVHLDAAMRLFDPDLAPEEAGPRQQRPRSVWSGFILANACGGSTTCCAKRRSP